MVRKAKIGLIFAASFALSFLREYVFESINSRLGAIYANAFQYELQSFLEPLNALSYKSLYIGKYFLILVFAILFLTLTLQAVWLIFKKKYYLKIVVYFFAAVLLLSFSVFAGGYLIGELNKGYTLSRYLIEFVESPLASFFIIPALFLLEKQNNPSS